MKKLYQYFKRSITFLLLVGFIFDHSVFAQEAQKSNREFDTFPIIGQNKEDIIPAEFLGKITLIILAGQSNMSGRGDMPKEPQEINPRVFVFGNNYRWRYAAEPVDDAQGQVDLVSRDGQARYSPAMSFANALLEKDSSLIIGFIPCARGATSIEKWQRNLSENSLYGSCFKRARAASTVGQIAGMLFWQGEADALHPEVYPQKKPSPFKWKEKFTRFVSDLRNDLGIDDLPVIYAQLNNQSAPERYIYWDQIKKQQEMVELPNVRIVKFPHLVLSDYVHFTKESYDIIGKHFAEGFWQLTHEMDN